MLSRCIFWAAVLCTLCSGSPLGRSGLVWVSSLIFRSIVRWSLADLSALYYWKRVVALFLLGLSLGFDSLDFWVGLCDRGGLAFRARLAFCFSYFDTSDIASSDESEWFSSWVSCDLSSIGIGSPISLRIFVGSPPLSVDSDWVVRGSLSIHSD